MTSRRRWVLGVVVPFVFAALACGGDDARPTIPIVTLTSVPTTPPTVESFPTTPPSATSGAIATLPAAVSSPVSGATLVPVTRPPTQAPAATATPAPLEPVVFDPPELVQGGHSVVYFNEPATNATVSFGGRQYPMLKDGERWWAIIGVGAFSSPGLAPVTIAYKASAQAATESIARSIAIVDRDFPVEYITLDPNTASLLAPDIVNNEIARRAAVFSGYTAQRLWNGAFIKPAAGAVSGIYGEGRSYNNGPVTDYHKGTDFVGGIGDDVYAAAAGKVVLVAELQVRGNSVVVDHGAGVMTAYHHLSEFLVSEGQTVTPGQLIAKMGSTGLVTGPHLHWEVIVRGIEVDGRLWLAGTEVGP